MPVSTALAFVALAALAQTPPTPATTPATGAASSDVVVASRAATITASGYTLFRIRNAAGGYTAEQRAEAVRDRLVPILSLENLRPEDIRVEQSRPFQDAALYVRDRLLVTVDRGMAQANGDKDPGTLARVWAERMRGILPRISVSSDDSPYTSTEAVKPSGG